MGTWGYKTFENDAASDWLYDLEEAKNGAFLLKPLQAVVRTRGKADLDDCLEALAAAEVIAGARYEPPSGVPSIARKWIRRVGLTPNNATVKLAIRAIGKVAGSSQLADAWQHKLAGWRKAVAQLSRRLVRALSASPPSRKAKPVAARQTLAELIIEVAANPTPEKRQELLKKLSKLGNPNRPVGGKGLNSMTPLHWVAGRGLLEEAKLLVSRGAIVDAEVGCMARPIAIALDRKRYAMVDYLIQAGADKNYVLWNAVRDNKIGIAEKLVKQGVDLLHQTKGKATLLHLAASNGATKSIEWLIEKGLDINARDCMGRTPLFDAIEKPSLAAVKVLVEHGADIHIKNNDGETPLAVAKLDFIPRSIARFLRQHDAS